ncbi:MAG: Rpn family recombination-promoting nuclease/putative transposase [Microscillaceae bacterium]|nr:Rpn family recombination-promoting nuclease/putative transposase [Microscillaceae bacterium]
MINQDLLWKGIIEDLFEEFLGYFYPDWTQNEVDLNKPFEFLDKELDEIYPVQNAKKRFADKLVKVFTKSGTEQWILVHIEVQGYTDNQFAERMFTYFYRIRERWKKEVIALAIFTDKNPDYQPNTYHYEKLDTVLEYKFKTFKLLHKTEADLTQAQNPFSIIMLTAWKSLQKVSQPDEQQLEWKVSLVRKLYEEGYQTSKIRNILNFIRYYIKFNDSLKEQLFEENIEPIIKNRKNMGIEETIKEELKRIYFEEGEQKGIEQGIEKGIEKGIRNLLKRGFSVTDTAEMLEVDKSLVEKVKKELDKES